MRYKRPSAEQVGIEIDPSIVALWRRQWPNVCNVVQGDAIETLRELSLDADTVLYADPPYFPDSRRRSRVYRYDYTSADHERLLECLTSLPCKVLISAYPSSFYSERLQGWSLYQFQARTHVETRQECVWFNFPKPDMLHDDRYLGDGFRKREVIRRRQERLRRRIEKLPRQERASLREWLDTCVAKDSRE